MNPRPPGWRAAVRVGICVPLLVWIFHRIFLQEAGKVIAAQGGSLDALSWLDQGSAAWRLGPQELWRTVRWVEPGALVLALGLLGLTILLGVLRWRMVLRVQGLDLPFSRTLEIALVAHFFNSFLLGSTGGDLLKAYYAARETRHLKAEAVTTVFVDRLVGLFCMLLFACGMMVPNLALLRSDTRLAAVTGFVVLMMAACGAVVALALWGGVSRVFPRARGLLARLPKAAMLERSLESCRRFGREGGLLFRAALLSMALNVVCVLHILVLERGLGMTVPPLALFALVPMIISVSALPITPSGLGVRENLFVLTLAAPAIGADPARALALSLLAYATSLAWSFLGGLVYLGLRQSQHLDEVARDARGESLPGRPEANG
jgi:hypothetical protein